MVAVNLNGQSPHGIDFAMDCVACHTSESWEIPSEYWTTENNPVFHNAVVPRFDHQTTDFPLEGSHETTNCKACHATLVFSDASTTCMSCHDDMHSQTVGDDCVRCHNTLTWLVDEIPELHEENGFPLVTPHNGLSCVDCHISETNLRFDRLGTDCINCHLDDYNNTQSPNHQEVGFSMACAECHPPLVSSWNTDQIVHSFFPLRGGHDTQDCQQCHFTDNFSDASPECVGCHQEDYDNTANPNHIAIGFSTDCNVCHTIDPDWQPARFTLHDDAYFPIYSGEHEGEWDNCTDCHTNPSDFTQFSCIDCHEHNNQGDLADEHNGVAGYIYESNACYACHPTGSEDGFNHNNTNFPLVGAHTNVSCQECHTDGFEGTPTDCFACHEADYNNTNNPNHIASGFPTECEQCHSESAWSPATFNHDDMYFPIYSGEHEGEWNQCTDCHTTANDYSVFSCIDCHEHNNAADLADDHDGVSDYTYESNACYSCHPDGKE